MNAASGAGRDRRTVAELARQMSLHPTPGADGLDAPIRGVTLDHRLVRPGDLFAALPGARTHGARFAPAALKAGAVAVLTDTSGSEAITSTGAHRPVLVTEDPRAVLGDVASWVHDHPARRLTTYGVTGTNGKTTTTYFLEYVLSALDHKTGLIGTAELKVGPDRSPARLTTPEAPVLHALLADMVAAGVDDVVMEVSSHALDLHRVDGVVYEVVGFTNLTQDHLDFHKDMEAYFAAKADLFTPARARTGVVLVDEAWGRRLVREAGIEVVTVSTTGADADWRVQAGPSGPEGTSIQLSGPEGTTVRVHVGLPGGFNVANAALALVMAMQAGAGPDRLEAVLSDGLNPVVPGRMELVATEPRVLVDFAHNTEALTLALEAVRSGASGRVIVVFGATGDRDRGKRPHMGKVAVEGADVVVITDDDPHDEDRASIRREVMSGAVRALQTAGRQGRDVELYEVAPRQAAIARSVRFASAADTVLIAGRGHETWQEIAGVDHHLDDRQEVRKAMAERLQAPPPTAGS